MVLYCLTHAVGSTLALEAEPILCDNGQELVGKCSIAIKQPPAYVGMSGAAVCMGYGVARFASTQPTDVLRVRVTSPGGRVVEDEGAPGHELRMCAEIFLTTFSQCPTAHLTLC